MVQSIVRTAYQKMKLSNIHRHHGCPKHAPTHVHETAGTPSPPYLHLPVDDNGLAARELISVLSAMQESESGAYDPSGKFTFHTDQFMHLLQLGDDLPNQKRSLVDEKCRAKMLDWCSKMVDYFEIDRNTVAVAAYYQDRYLGTVMGEAARNDRALFRVVSVTSLYIAIKLRVPHRWNVTSHAFAQLCQGSVSGEEINDMETNILFALGWYVNPPIPMEYSEAFLDLIFNSTQSRRRRSISSQSEEDSVLGDYFLPSSKCDSFQDDASLEELKEHLLELVQYQLEIALHDHRLFQVRSSAIATAAVLNALEGVMNESPSFQEGLGGTSFCQEGTVLVLNTMSLCNLASEKELEDIRSALLSSVVSPRSADEIKESSAVAHRSHLQNCTEPPPRAGSPTISSSPTSTSKFWSPNKMCEPALTPYTVLSKVFAFHYI